MISAQEQMHSDVKGQENSGQASGDRLNFSGVQAPGDQSRMVQQSDVRGTDDQLRFPGSTGNPEVTEPGALDWKVYHWMSKREQQSASSSAGRDESQHPSAQASGDRLQSTLEEDTGMKNMLSPGGQAYSELGDEGGRKPQGKHPEN